MSFEMLADPAPWRTNLAWAIVIVFAACGVSVVVKGIGLALEACWLWVLSFRKVRRVLEDEPAHRAESYLEAQQELYRRRQLEAAAKASPTNIIQFSRVSR